CVEISEASPAKHVASMPISEPSELHQLLGKGVVGVTLVLHHDGHRVPVVRQGLVHQPPLYGAAASRSAVPVAAIGVVAAEDDLGRKAAAVVSAKNVEALVPERAQMGHDPRVRR